MMCRLCRLCGLCGLCRLCRLCRLCEHTLASIRARKVQACSRFPCLLQQPTSFMFLRPLQVMKAMQAMQITIHPNIRLGGLHRLSASPGYANSAAFSGYAAYASYLNQLLIESQAINLDQFKNSYQSKRTEVEKKASAEFIFSRSTMFC